ncbi:hypothetical protein C8F04DRAFT_1183812 [Mycena alexandri]|uniref:Uncharacterized protein n=1 Tax=Mycena alexandri TaxID=1745969 RepID=A0AAD6SUB6_9AGAR|nr:hypothetical protein C8F04DRAFT_1183812 [Mycena alexandri]
MNVEPVPDFDCNIRWRFWVVEVSKISERLETRGPKWTISFFGGFRVVVGRPNGAIPLASRSRDLAIKFLTVLIRTPFSAILSRFSSPPFVLLQVDTSFDVPGHSAAWEKNPGTRRAGSRLLASKHSRIAASSKSSTAATSKTQSRPKPRKPAAASSSAAALFSSDSDVAPPKVRSSRDNDNYEPEAPTPKKRDFAAVDSSPDDDMPDPNTLSSISGKKASAPKARPKGKKNAHTERSKKPPGIPANSSQAPRRRRSLSASASAPAPKRIKLNVPVEVLSDSLGDDAPLGTRSSVSAKPARSSPPVRSEASDHGEAAEGTPIPEGAIDLAEYRLPDSLGLVDELPPEVRFRRPSVGRWFVFPRIDLAVLEQRHPPLEDRLRPDNADPALFPTKASQNSADASWCAGFDEHPQRMVDQYSDAYFGLNVLRYQRPYLLPFAPLPEDDTDPIYKMPGLRCSCTFN